MFSALNLISWFYSKDVDKRNAECTADGCKGGFDTYKLKPNYKALWSETIAESNEREYADNALAATLLQRQ